MNHQQRSIAIAVPGLLVSLPACAHGGLVLLYIGLPFLAALFLVYLIWSMGAAPTGKRFMALIESLFVGALWLVVFFVPWLQSEFDIALRDYEVVWTATVPCLLLVGSWILRKRAWKK